MLHHTDWYTAHPSKMSVTIYQMKIFKWGMGKLDKPKTRRDEQRRKYSEIDERAKDKLVRSPGENGG